MIFPYLPLAFGLIILGVALGQGKIAAIGVAMLAAPFVLLPLVGLLGSLRVIREFPAEWRRSSPFGGPRWPSAGARWALACCCWRSPRAR